MKTIKQKLQVEVEVLDTQAAPKLIQAAVMQLMRGVTSGKLETECGDAIKWECQAVPVEF